MTKPYIISLTAVLLILIIGCGSDGIEKGQMAFDNKDYTNAIDFWSKVLSQDSSQSQLNEKIATAYLLRGNDIYSRLRNVEAFNGNLVKAMDYLPQQGSSELHTLYKNTLCAVAEAYMNTRPANQLEEDKFQQQATMYLKKVKQIDSTFSRADSLLQKMKDEHYQQLLDKGKNLYTRARKTRNVDYYFTAEYYLKEALQFDEKNSEIHIMLRNIKAKILPVLNYRDEIAMAVTDVKRQPDEIILNVTVKNYTPSALKLDIDKFRLLDKSGNIYNHDRKIMDVFYADMSLKDTNLNQSNPLAEGVLVFPVNEDTKLYALEYTIEKNKVSRKYFP